MPTAYSADDGAPGIKPKHQWIVSELMAPDSAAFERRIAGFLAEVPDHVHTILISTEGLYNHWWDFSEAGRAALGSLAARHEVEVWLWLREPVAFFLSNYVQMLINSPQRVKCYGQDWSPEQMFEDDWFRRRLDYGAFLKSAERVFGPGSIRPFAYRRSTVADCFTALGLGHMASPEVLVHWSLGEWGVKQIREVNRSGVGPSEKAEAVRRIRLEERQVSGLARPLQIEPELRDRVLEYCADSLDYLKNRYGIVLGSGRNDQ